MTEEKKPHYLMEWFKYEHLRDDLKLVSAPFCQVAAWADESLSDGIQKDVCLQHLMDAKDAAVRQAMKK